MISRTFIVFLSITQVVSQDIQVSQGQHVDRRLQQQAYGTSQTQDTSYQAAAPPAAAYSAEASNVLPTTPYKVEVRLGCSCSLNIPCFDMKSKKCVPVICGFNGQVSFIDNRVPRYHHQHYADDDYAAKKAKTGAYGKKGGDADSKTDKDSANRNLQYTATPSTRPGFSNKQEAGTYSNPVINGCKCPSGATRCYECAEINRGGKIFQWVLAFLFLALLSCCAKLTLSDPMPPLPLNQEALGYVMMCTLILGFAALNAAATASDAGYWVRPWDLRRIYIIRWIDWLVSSLLMCWILTWLCGSAGTGERLHLMVLDALMIFMGFMATVVEGTMKWVFFLFAFLFYIWVAQKLCRMNGASPGGLKVAKGLIFTITKFLILVLWFFYPLIWLMAPGLNHWCASSEATMFGILDFVLKLAFCGIITMSRPFFTVGSDAPAP